MRLVDRRCGAVVLVALAVGALAVPAPAPGAAAGTTSVSAAPSASVSPDKAAQTRVVHRVVWDQQRPGSKGIHLRSARADGSDVRRVYDFRAGFTLQLSLDPEGRRVAFATCCQDDFPQLVVAAVAGGKTWKPLARHPYLFSVGGIGWSPNGRRLAFEAISLRQDPAVKGIWTIRPDGRDLRLVLERPRLDADDQPVINEALAWTAEGILYSDGSNLRSARHGRSRLVMRNVRSVRISGDHSRIVVQRHRGGRMSTWIADPDGTDPRRLFYRGTPGVTATYHDVTPSYDATSLLAWRERPNPTGSAPDQGFVTWKTEDRPGTAVELVLAGKWSYVGTWN